MLTSRPENLFEGLIHAGSHMQSIKCTARIQYGGKESEAVANGQFDPFYWLFLGVCVCVRPSSYPCVSSFPFPILCISLGAELSKYNDPSMVPPSLVSELKIFLRNSCTLYAKSHPLRVGHALSLDLYDGYLTCRLHLYLRSAC